MQPADNNQPDGIDPEYTVGRIVRRVGSSTDIRYVVRWYANRERKITRKNQPGTCPTFYYALSEKIKAQERQLMSAMVAEPSRSAIVARPWALACTLNSWRPAELATDGWTAADHLLWTPDLSLLQCLRVRHSLCEDPCTSPVLIAMLRPCITSSTTTALTRCAHFSALPVAPFVSFIATRRCDVSFSPITPW